MKSLAVIVGLLSVALFIGATSADARIRCNGPWQIVDGSEIASPYCGDRYLARVAREYGMRVSARAIRRDISVKDEVCQLIGHDNRVSDICTGFRIEHDNNGGRRRR